MSDIPTKLVIDLSKPAGDPEREMVIPLTDEEIAQLEADRTAVEEQQAAEEAEEAARLAAKQAAQDKLTALGLTPEEIAAITGA